MNFRKRPIFKLDRNQVWRIPSDSSGQDENFGENFVSNGHRTKLHAPHASSRRRPRAGNGTHAPHARAVKKTTSDPLNPGDPTRTGLTRFPTRYSNQTEKEYSVGIFRRRKNIPSPERIFRRRKEYSGARKFR